MTDDNDKNSIDDLLHGDIIDILGLSGLEETRKQELRDEIVITIQNRVFMRIMDELEKKNKIEEYDNLSDDLSVEKFFLENGIDTEKYFLEEVFAYKAQLQTTSKLIDIGFKPQVKIDL